jgi:hypothetical protein
MNTNHNNKNGGVSKGNEEVAVYAATNWYESAKFRSDVQSDLISYYEGYRDAMDYYDNKKIIDDKEVPKFLNGEDI